jgi:hypothetical protein
MTLKNPSAVIASAIVTCCCTALLAQLPREGAIAKAEGILKNLREGNAGEVVKEFDATMTQGLPEAKLRQVWPTLVGQVGAFRSITERREGRIQGMQAVELMLSFEKGALVQRTVFDASGRVAGLFFQPEAAAVLPAAK